MEALLRPKSKLVTSIDWRGQCLGPTYTGDFALKGSDLRKRGLNRVGNMLVPNSNYCAFEDWVMPLFDAMLEEQRQGMNWTPSKVGRPRPFVLRLCSADEEIDDSPHLFQQRLFFCTKCREQWLGHCLTPEMCGIQMIARLGKEIDNSDSIYYWAQKNHIPVYCPGLTDGSIGDMLFFHTYKNPGLRLDIVEDIRLMNDEALKAAPQKTGIIVLGGGAPHNLSDGDPAGKQLSFWCA